MEVEDAKRFKELEIENATMKRRLTCALRKNRLLSDALCGQ